MENRSATSGSPSCGGRSKPMWRSSINAADAEVAVVTPIDLDHTHLLGSTISEITREKAGIIKPGAHAILAGQSVEAAEILLARCAEVGALPQREGVDFGVIDRKLAVS